MLETASGHAWGRPDSFVMRMRGTVLAKSLGAALSVIRDRRAEWDGICVGTQVLEKKSVELEEVTGIIACALSA
jgi:imidazoleglycerol phosphate synthase glutamine amidotransferase subunit HisH